MDKKSPNKTSREPKHPIGVVSRRTGIPQDLLRAWERRYDAVIPGRGATGRRLYSDADIQRLRLLKQAVDGGRRISDVVGLELGDLENLVREDRAETAPPMPSTRSGGNGAGESDAILTEVVDAIESLDRHRLESALSEAAISLTSPRLRQDVIVPLMHVVGDRWREGTLRIAQEHMASAIVRRFVDRMRSGNDRDVGPRVVVTTPSGQRHELGALMVAAAAEEAGWSVTYLGADLPAEEIAAAVRQVGARAVALSIVYSADEQKMRDEIVKLRRFLDPDVKLLVGGRAAGALDDVIEETGAQRLEDIADLQEALEGF